MEMASAISITFVLVDHVPGFQPITLTIELLSHQEQNYIKTNRLQNDERK